MNPINFSEDKEQLLQTLSRFDDNITVEDVTDSGATSKIHSENYHTFFLHVLLENLCKYIEPNAQKREILFSEVCKRLSGSKFVNDTVVLDSLLPLRRELARQFFKYVKQIHCQVVPDPSENSVTADSFLEEGNFCTELQLQYRYEQSFKELEVIGEGGFGVVCKAKHKVTDIVYAVKKVIFKYKSDSAYLKVIREAKNIAALNHPNIVSYNNAWIECLPLSECDSAESRNSSSEGTASNSNDSDTEIMDQMCVSQCSEALYAIMDKENKSPSLEVVFSNGYAETDTRQRSSSKGVFSENYTVSKNAFSFLSLDSKTSSSRNSTWTTSDSEDNQSKEEDFKCGAEKSKSWDPSCLNVRVMLCIQMEYCDCDLRLWLVKRAEGKEQPFTMNVMNIFKDILKGVIYIHSKGIIHRDLKPQNIFFSKTSNVLKIGDFGLATLTSFTASDASGVASNQHSANLGTLPYAAPEQIKCKSYDSKVDIYSLGVILIELLYVFSTEMELCNAIKKILEESFPKEIEEECSNHIHLVKNLVKKNPEDRICAKEILSQLQSLENSQIQDDKNPVKTNPEDKISAKEMQSQLQCLENSSNEITRLRVALMEKEEEITRLQAIVKKQESIINKQRVELGQ